MNGPALALLEFSSIAIGIQAGDAMVKRAPVERIYTGTVQPGHYLALVSGDVATVEEAVGAGRAVGQAALRDLLFLPNAHPDLIEAMVNAPGERPLLPADALGIVETETVAAAIHAADAGLKGADVQLALLRLADGLGGKGVALFTGFVSDVEAAVALAVAVADKQLIQQIVISQLHEEMWANMVGNGRFGAHFRWGAL
jgi:microcompartment protein CcmL/EutN